MADPTVHIRCQRCGEPMDLVDPAPGQPWTPQQYWVCPACGRHFWSTYAGPTGRAEPRPAPSAPAPAATAPADGPAPSAQPV